MAPDCGLILFANLEATLGYADCFKGELLVWWAPFCAISLGLPSPPPYSYCLSLTLAFGVVLLRWKLALVGDLWPIRTAPWRPSRSFSFISSCCQTEPWLLPTGPLSAKRLAAASPSRRKSLLALRVGLAMAAFIVLVCLCRVPLVGWRTRALETLLVLAYLLSRELWFIPFKSKVPA
jgi:hypothetical protein